MGKVTPTARSKASAQMKNQDQPEPTGTNVDPNALIEYDDDYQAGRAVGDDDDDDKSPPEQD